MGSPWGAAITSFSAGLQAIVGNRSISKAAKSQQIGIGQAQGTLKDQYGKTQAYLDPYAKAGQTGLNNAESMLKSGYQFNASDPSYAWRLEQGQKALERSAASRGQLLSGGMLKALTGYSQGMASQEYGNQFGRNMQMAGLGYNAASQQAGYSNQFGSQTGGLQMDAANADAASIMAKYRNWAALDSQAAGAWSGYFGGNKGSIATDNAQSGQDSWTTAGRGSTLYTGNYSYGASNNMGNYSQPWQSYTSNSANNGTGFGSTNYGSSSSGTGQAGNFGGSWQSWLGSK